MYRGTCGLRLRIVIHGVISPLVVYVLRLLTSRPYPFLSLNSGVVSGRRARVSASCAAVFGTFWHCCPQSNFRYSCACLTCFGRTPLLSVPAQGWCSSEHHLLAAHQFPLLSICTVALLAWDGIHNIHSRKARARESQIGCPNATCSEVHDPVLVSRREEEAAPVYKPQKACHAQSTRGEVSAAVLLIVSRQLEEWNRKVAPTQATTM